jgi:hypothetical protein
VASRLGRLIVPVLEVKFADPARRWEGEKIRGAKMPGTDVATLLQAFPQAYGLFPWVRNMKMSQILSILGEIYWSELGIWTFEMAELICLNRR